NAQPTTSSTTNRVMCSAYTRVGLRRLTSSTYGVTVPAASRPINSHGSRQANVARRTDSDTNDQVSEKRRIFVRPVAKAVRQCSKATTATSGALNESTARSRVPNRYGCTLQASPAGTGTPRLAHAKSAQVSAAE